MKVIEDKVTVYPPHGLCKTDVPLIISALPAEWTADIRTVRLSSALNENPRLAGKPCDLLCYLSASAFR